MAGKQRITSSKKTPSKEVKKQRLEKKWEEWNSDYDVYYCWLGFIVWQQEKGNSKATLDFYKRFYKKFSIEILTTDTMQAVFMNYLESQELNKQTVNSYLRGLRSFGNWCEEEGYLDGFKCPIKEVEPPIKQVYTDKELDKLLVKPKVTDFADFRTYCVLSLILATGARSNTILNIRICDLELDEGYINFNTTKAHKVVRLGLPKKVRRDLSDWVNYWRYDKGAEPTDFLFCNEYGEQLSRDGLAKSFRKYNQERGVEKTSLHLLRHTFAKNWITSGGDIVTLARVLTHSELEMVKRYANLYGGDIKKEIEEHSTINQLKTRSGKTIKNQKRKLTDID